jgi:hypothetical protein
MRHLLLRRLLIHNAKEKVSMSMGGKIIDAAGGRKEMLKIIENFRKEGERRRSWVPPFHSVRIRKTGLMGGFAGKTSIDGAQALLRWVRTSRRVRLALILDI